MNWRSLVAFSVLFAVSSTCLAQRARIPVIITTGWETTIYPIGEVVPGSPAAQEFGEGAVVSYTLDRLWFIVPFWNRSGEFSVSKPFERGEKPADVWVFRDQSREAIAGATGLPVGAIRRPWYSYVPLGWPLVILIYAGVSVCSGPSPRKKFEAIWADPGYRAALAVMFGNDELLRPEMPTMILLDAEPCDPEIVLADLVPALAEQGIPKRVVERNLLFAYRYLIDNQHVAMREPGTFLPPANDAGSPDSNWNAGGPSG